MFPDAEIEEESRGNFQKKQRSENGPGCFLYMVILRLVGCGIYPEGPFSAGLVEDGGDTQISADIGHGVSLGVGNGVPKPAIPVAVLIILRGSVLQKNFNHPAIRIDGNRRFRKGFKIVERGKTCALAADSFQRQDMGRKKMASEKGNCKSGGAAADAKEFFARVGLDGGSAAFADKAFFQRPPGKQQGKKQEKGKGRSQRGGENFAPGPKPLNGAAYGAQIQCKGCGSYGDIQDGYAKKTAEQRFAVRICRRLGCPAFPQDSLGPEKTGGFQGGAEDRSS